MEEIAKLPVREECVRFISYKDLENLITSVYGVYQTEPLHPYGYFNFNLPYLMQWNNDEMHEVQARREKLDKWQQEDIDDFMKDPYGTEYTLDTLLVDMCNNGYIEEGVYIVEVSW